MNTYPTVYQSLMSRCKNIIDNFEQNEGLIRAYYGEIQRNNSNQKDLILQLERLMGKIRLADIEARSTYEVLRQFQ